MTSYSEYYDVGYNCQCNSQTIEFPVYEENFRIEQLSKLNQMAFVLHKMNHYLRHFVAWYESFSGYFYNGNPVMLEYE